MIVFVDTSALFALLVQTDEMHARARQQFEFLASNEAALVTSAYVLLETLTLLQRRVGLDAVWDFNLRIAPLLEVIWVDDQWHHLAMQRLTSEGQRDLSLADCLSFEIMEARAITTAFAFDARFTDRGFSPPGPA